MSLKMGSASSLNLSEIETSSSHACHVCGQESVDVDRCDTCKNDVCTNCCSHRPRNQSSLYGKKLELVSEEKIPDEPKQTFKRVRCASLLHNGKLVVLCSFYVKDKKCQCCEVTSYWKMCLSGGKSEILIKRLHDTETDKHPGQIATCQHYKYAYLTIPYKRTVYRFSSYDVLYESFKTMGKCYGIALFDGGLAVSILIESALNVAQWQIQYLTFDGTFKKRVSYNADGTELFEQPRFLASNLDQSILFVSDADRHAVVALNAKGTVLYQHTSHLIKSPRGLTVDNKNNVYVADGHTVVQIEAGGRQSNVLLELKNKKDKNEVATVCFEHSKKNLIIILSDGTITRCSFLLT